MSGTSQEATTITRTSRFGLGFDAFTKRRAWLLGAGLALLLCGCKDSAIIKKEEVKSPDGYWTARMEIEQFGGPGTAGLQTNVYLFRSNTGDKPIDILAFNDRSTADAEVQMRWVGDRRLEVAHSPESEVTFQVVKCCGDITITVHYTDAVTRR